MIGQSKSRQSTNVFRLEELEARRLLSATPIGVASTAEAEPDVTGGVMETTPFVASVNEVETATASPSTSPTALDDLLASEDVSMPAENILDDAAAEAPESGPPAIGDEAIAETASADARDELVDDSGAEDAAIDFPQDDVGGEADEPAAPVEPPYSPPDFYAIDGRGNNVDNLSWGQAGEQLRRETTVDYGDEISEPAGADRPSPRAISNAVSAQLGLMPNERGLSDFVWQWGQFVDHDIDLTETGQDETIDIAVPAGDPEFDPDSSGESVITTDRSAFDETTGSSAETPRQQTNSITAFIDGSQIYGSDADRAAGLREFTGGRLRMSEGGYLPKNDSGYPNANPIQTGDDELYLAGDVRANEQAGLTALHTLFVREHNRIADDLVAANPGITDEDAFQSARRQVIALLQSITYREFLPALLGEDALSEYTGYDATVNPQIANVFSTAAFRFGHSMVSGSLLQSYGDADTADHDLHVRDTFFNPDVFHDGAMTPTLRGLAYQTAQEIDTFVVDDLRNFLFGPPGAGGLDLVSLNIARGRDHGLPSFNQSRIDVGLEPIDSFDQLTSDQAVQRALAETYGDMDNVDVWIGAIAERHVEGASVGEFVHTALVDQFTRLRVGDRFWHESVLSEDELAYVQSTTLADIIERNTSISDAPGNLFVSHAADDHGNSSDNATNLMIDGDRSGVIENVGDQDVFVLEAIAGDRLSIQTSLDSLTDSTLTITDSTGTEVAFNDDGFRGLSSSIQFDVHTTGHYFVTVAGFGDAVGSYDVSVREQHRHASSPAEATTIFAGTETRGGIDRFAASEWFEFNVAAGRRYSIETSLLSLEDSVLRLYDGNLNQVQIDDDSGEDFGSRIELSPLESGTYFASVNAFSVHQRGDYNLRLREV